MRSRMKLVWVGAALLAPMMMGARGGGCGGPLTSMTPTPDVEGDWAVTYDDALHVEIGIGGATYDATLPEEGGTVMVEHGGYLIPFTLDCSRPEIVCPSEAWPDRVSVSQREPEYPHRMWVTIPQQECMGTMRDPDPSECGANTLVTTEKDAVKIRPHLHDADRWCALRIRLTLLAGQEHWRTWTERARAVR